MDPAGQHHIRGGLSSQLNYSHAGVGKWKPARPQGLSGSVNKIYSLVLDGVARGFEVAGVRVGMVVVQMDPLITIMRHDPDPEVVSA